MKKRMQKGSLTIEMVCLIPIIGMVFVFCVWGGFYFHDKNIISSCVYETAVVGSVKAREKEGVSEEVLVNAFQERIRGKCILFAEVVATVQVSEEQITVSASAKKRDMGISVIHIAPVTDPEGYIRKIKRLE